MTHPERVHSRAQLLDRVWGDHVFIEERTVDVHIKRLREALTPVHCAQLVETVRGPATGCAACTGRDERLRSAASLPRCSGWRRVPRLGWWSAARSAPAGWGAACRRCSRVWRSPRRSTPLRAERLMNGCAARRRMPAPRDAGFWGEIGYRVEKALRGCANTRPRPSASACAQFLQAIDASPNGVMLLDADDRIEWCNARAADHFGLDPVRDQRQNVTNLLRAPAFVELSAER